MVKGKKKGKGGIGETFTLYTHAEFEKYWTA
jgi:hypothetical protein